MFRLILSAIVGYILGHERKRHDKSGGSRTMALICMTATLLAIISQDLNCAYTFDFVRLMSYLLPAVGFIGMGIIHRTKNSVDGLTTSATLLILLPIGFAIGLNYYFYAIATSIITYLILERKYYEKRRIRTKNNK